MATAATIAINLEANTAALKKGFQQTSQATKSLSRQMKQSLGSGIVKLNAALGTLSIALQSVRRGFDAVMESVERRADLGDFADRIGISVEKLQQLRLVTEQFGGSADVMNMGLQRMSRRIAEANATGNTLSKSLEEVGINVQSLAMMRPDEQFLRFSEAISRVKNKGDQLKLTMALMDTEGVALVDTLRQGSDALRENMGAMDDSLIVTREQVLEAQRLSAQLKIVRAEWQKAKDDLLVKVVPALKETLKWFTRLLDAAVLWKEDYQAMFGGGPTFDDSLIFNPKKGGLREALNELEMAMADGGKAAAEEIAKPLERIRRIAIPAAGAVTSTSVAGFSAAEAAKRRQREQAAFEKMLLAKTDEVIEAIDAEPDLALVDL